MNTELFLGKLVGVLLLEGLKDSGKEDFPLVLVQVIVSVVLRFCLGLTLFWNSKVGKNPVGTVILTLEKDVAPKFRDLVSSVNLRTLCRKFGPETKIFPNLLFLEI